MPSFSTDMQHYQIRLCAWCQKSLGNLPCDKAQHGQITHGICNDCKEKMKIEIKSKGK